MSHADISQWLQAPPQTGFIFLYARWLSKVAAEANMLCI